MLLCLQYLKAHSYVPSKVAKHWPIYIYDRWNCVVDCYSKNGGDMGAPEVTRATERDKKGSAMSKKILWVRTKWKTVALPLQ